MSTQNDYKHLPGGDELSSGSPEVLRQQPASMRKQEEIADRFTSSGMTPSIVTTINNTNPAPFFEQAANNKTNHEGNVGYPTRSDRRISEPYESYIEDSFVGHWEHEDDGYGHQEESGAESQNGCELDKSDLQNPSTIEFDFDSFGPESIIYSPMNNQQSTRTNVSTRPPPLIEVSREAEKADEMQDREPNLNELAQLGNQSKPKGENDRATDQDDDAPIPSDLLHRTRAANLCPSEYIVDLAQVDLKVIEPYKKVISHAGYCHHFDPDAPEPNLSKSAPAVIIFSACYLPDRSRRDYNYVMDHLFLYVLSSLNELIADDYILIYLHNTQQPNSKGVSTNSGSQTGSREHATSTAQASESQSPNNMPTFSWMKRCYQMIDRKLRKNLKVLYLVKPTFWLKTIVVMCKPFISAKFSKKLKFIEDMEALRNCIPVDKLILPASAENI